MIQDHCTSFTHEHTVGEEHVHIGARFGKEERRYALDKSSWTALVVSCPNISTFRLSSYCLKSLLFDEKELCRYDPVFLSSEKPTKIKH